MQAYLDRHFYRGPQPRPELERMKAEKSTDVYRAMQGPNEWTVTGALEGWDVRQPSSRRSMIRLRDPRGMIAMTLTVARPIISRFAAVYVPGPRPDSPAG
jgi:hypothetical protein